MLENTNSSHEINELNFLSFWPIWKIPESAKKSLCVCMCVYIHISYLSTHILHIYILFLYFTHIYFLLPPFCSGQLTYPFLN